MSLEVLNLTRRKLNDALGEKSTNYFNYLNQWFRMTLTIEEFDTEARQILSQDQVYLHCDFLLALLNKVDGLGEQSITAAISHNRNIRKRRRANRVSEKSNFEHLDLRNHLPPSLPPGAGSDGVSYAAQEIYLPIHELVVGRFMSAAWQFGLEGVGDDAAGIIIVAVQHLLKNVISAVITQRKGYKMWNRHYMYDVGSDMPNMWLCNTPKLYQPQSEGPVSVDDGAGALTPRCPPIIDELEQSAAFRLTCSMPNPEPNSDKLTIDEFYNTLLTHKNVIACHSVYAAYMEKLAVMLNHPSD